MWDMDRVFPFFAAVAFLAVGVASVEASPQRQEVSIGGPYARALEAEHPQDPADSLYRAAVQRLNQDDYSRAAEMFARIQERYPRSNYAAQALYYQAFALYRNGREEDLRAGLDALRLMQDRYADAYTSLSEAQTLAARIQGALARRGDSRAAEDIARQAREIRERTRSGRQSEGCEGEDEMRLAALNALLQMSSERALPIIEKVLANPEDDPCSVALRRKAVFLLAQHVSEENLDLLLDLVRNDPDREVRAQAVFWLSQVPGERTVTALEQILRESDDLELQKKALFALSQSGGERANQVLRDYALREDAPLELRETAIFWIGQSEGAAAGNFLRELYGRTSDPKLREKVIFSVAQRGGRDNASWLLDRAVDTNEPVQVRKAAIFWAGQSGVSIEELVGLYDRLPDREMKEQLIFTLSQRSEPAAVNKMLDIARNETDAELRKKAIFWLSQSDDPRVVELLMELIEGK